MIERNQKENIKSIIYDNWAWIIVGVFFLIVGIYLAIYGQDIYIQVHDNLDSNIAALKMLKDKGLFWEHGVKLPFLGGVHDRNYLYSEFKLYSLLYYIFPVFPAYILGCFLRMVISIIGYLVLLKCICKEEKRYRNLAILSGFLYGILPVFPTAGLSFAAVPLYFALLIQIYKKPSWKWYVLLFLCTSLTDFILFGIFGCGWLLLFCIIDGIRHRKIPWNMFLALVVMSGGYVITDYRLFYLMCFSGEVTLRSSLNGTLELSQILKDSISVGIKSFYHAGTLQQYFVLPVCSVYYCILNIGYWRKGERRKIWTDPYNILLYWAIFNIMIYGINSLEVFKNLIRAIVPVLSGFSFARTVWLNPFLLYFAFFILLKRIYDKGYSKATYIMLTISFAVIVCMPETYNDIRRNIANQVKVTLGRPLEELTYEEFYAEDLFTEIKQDLNYQDEFAVAFGFHPSVLIYNGFSTLDGYLSYYSQDYKETFRTLVAPMLEDSKTFRDTFDSWGGRAWLFSEEVGIAGWTMPCESAQLHIDSRAFRKMGGTYILSRVRITNAEDIELEFVKRYQKQDLPYIIYVYQLEESSK